MGGVRPEPRLDRLLTALARRRRTTKSALTREPIRRYLTEERLAVRAREQSLRAGDGETRLEHDDRGWTA